jgi:Gamma-glutamyl cyclotransferase, AIG2-like
MSFLYFAYGSNMLSERLAARCPSARPLGHAVARGFVLSFSKRSVDGSAKATLIASQDSARTVHGVLFELARGDLPGLDAVEGLGIGYDRDDAFPVMLATDGHEALASTYLAPVRARDDGLVPYDWYLALTVAGALQHGLPDSHIAGLRAMRIVPDPDPGRATRLEALELLRRSGFDGVLTPRPA